MPLRNRVTPFGDITAVKARGTMMGNRGIIHNPSTRQLLSRRWQHHAWVCCVLSYKGYQHPIMGVGRYTELFFLDEATAFAAGHRPCAYCRRSDFNAFKAAWAKAHDQVYENLRAPALDRHLHAQRVTRGRAQITYEAALGALPDGTLVAIDGQAWLVHGQKRLEWSPTGYRSARAAQGKTMVTVLTPQPAVAAFAHGYLPALHPSARALV